ncbi:HEAT repeat domain-containing protein [bacterium]|nr:HEAT repeat domain-containing protein [bacterium]
MSITELQSKINNPELSIRHQALKQLVILSNHESYGLLMYISNNHFSPETRHEAKKASLIVQKFLFSDQEKKEISQPFSDEEKQALLQLKNEEAKIRIEALHHLKNSNNPKVIDQLSRFLQTERDSDVLILAIESLSHLGKTRSIPFIASFLRSKNENIRKCVLDSLAKIKGDDAISLMIRFTRDSSEIVRNSSLIGLKNFQHQEILSVLHQLIQKENAVYKDAVLFTIVKLEIKEAFPLLEGLSQDSSEKVAANASKAIEILKRKGIYSSKTEATQGSAPTEVSTIPKETSPEIESTTSKESSEITDNNEIVKDEEEEQIHRTITHGEESAAVDALFELMSKEYFAHLAELREKIVERGSRKLLATYLIIIAQSKDLSHKEFLLECLKHPDARVQANTIDAIKSLGLVELKDQLLPLLESNHDRVKTSALIFLHPLGAVDTKKILTSMLKSRSDNRKLSAIFAITDISDPEFIPMLELAMDAPNPKVSSKAIETLKIFVLLKEDCAIKLANQWGILSEMEEQEISEEEVLDEEASSDEEKAEDNSEETPKSDEKSVDPSEKAREDVKASDEPNSESKEKTNKKSKEDSKEAQETKVDEENKEVEKPEGKVKAFFTKLFKKK